MSCKKDKISTLNKKATRGAGICGAGIRDSISLWFFASDFLTVVTPARDLSDVTDNISQENLGGHVTTDFPMESASLVDHITQQSSGDHVTSDDRPRTYQRSQSPEY